MSTSSSDLAKLLTAGQVPRGLHGSPSHTAAQTALQALTIKQQQHEHQKHATMDLLQTALRVVTLALAECYSNAEAATPTTLETSRWLGSVHGALLGCVSDARRSLRTQSSGMLASAGSSGAFASLDVPTMESWLGLRRWARLAQGLGLNKTDNNNNNDNDSNAIKSPGRAHLSFSTSNFGKAPHDANLTFRTRVRRMRQQLRNSFSTSPLTDVPLPSRNDDTLPPRPPPDRAKKRPDHPGAARNGPEEDSRSSSDDESTTDGRRDAAIRVFTSPESSNINLSVTSQVRDEFAELLRAPSSCSVLPEGRRGGSGSSAAPAAVVGGHLPPVGPSSSLQMARLASVKVRQPGKRAPVGAGFVKWVKEIDREASRSQRNVFATGLGAGDTNAAVNVDDLLYEACVRVWYVMEAAGLDTENDPEGVNVQADLQAICLGKAEYDPARHSSIISSHFQFRTESQGETNFASNSVEAAKLSVRRGVHHTLSLLKMHEHPYYNARRPESDDNIRCPDDWSSRFFQRESSRLGAQMQDFTSSFSSKPQANSSSNKKKKHFFGKAGKNRESVAPTSAQHTTMKLEPSAGSPEATILRQMAHHGHNCYQRLLAGIFRFAALGRSQQASTKSSMRELPAIWRTFLRIFQMLYGISDVFASQTALSIVASSFDFTFSQLYLVAQMCANLYDAIGTEDSTFLPMSGLDRAHLVETLKTLDGQCKNCVKSFFTCFSDDADGHASIKELFSLLLLLHKLEASLHGHLSQPQPDSVASQVRKCMEHAADILYHGFVLRADAALALPDAATMTNPFSEGNLLLVGDMIVQFLSGNKSEDSSIGVDGSTARCFVKDFERGVGIDLVEIFAQVFCLNFGRDISEFADRVLRSASTDADVNLVLSGTMLELFEMSVTVNDLVSRSLLTTFERDASRLATESAPLIPLSSFDPIVSLWINQITPRMEGWVRDALNLDTWLPIGASDESDGAPSVPASSSVFDLFHIISRPLLVLLRPGLRKCERPGAPGRFFTIYRSSMERSIGVWCERVVAEAMAGVPAEVRAELKIFVASTVATFAQHNPSTPQGFARSFAPVSGKSRSQSVKLRAEVAFKKFVRISSADQPPPHWIEDSWSIQGQVSARITTKDCILMNNVESARDQLASFADTCDGELDDLLVDLFAMLKVTLWKVAAVLIFKLNEGAVVPSLLRSVLDLSIARSSSSARVESVNSSSAFIALLGFLDDQIAVMAQTLFHQNFNRLLKLLWEVLMSDFSDMIVQGYSIKGGKLKALWDLRCPSEVLEPAVDILLDYFHAEGEGLSKKVLESGSATFVRSILIMSDIDTTSLIELYGSFRKLEAARLEQHGPVHFVASNDVANLLRSRPRDLEACRFVSTVTKTSNT